MNFPPPPLPPSSATGPHGLCILRNDQVWVGRGCMPVPELGWGWGGEEKSGPGQVVSRPLSPLDAPGGGLALPSPARAAPWAAAARLPTAWKRIPNPEVEV